MYLPSQFEVSDFVTILEFIRKNSFGTLITIDANSRPFASHVPFLVEPLDEGSSEMGLRLLAHVAKANPAWKHFCSDVDSASNRCQADVLVIFQGADAYVSPSWYESKVAVPTWNYTAVHVYGTPKLITRDSQMDDLLNRTVSEFERSLPNPWRDGNDEELRRKLKQAIVGFEIRATTLEAKFKLNQNRPLEDRIGVAHALTESSNQQANALAELMQKEGLLQD